MIFASPAKNVGRYSVNFLFCFIISRLSFPFSFQSRAWPCRQKLLDLEVAHLASQYPNIPIRPPAESNALWLQRRSTRLRIVCVHCVFRGLLCCQKNQWNTTRPIGNMPSWLIWFRCYWQRSSTLIIVYDFKLNRLGSPRILVMATWNFIRRLSNKVFDFSLNEGC